MLDPDYHLLTAEQRLRLAVVRSTREALPELDVFDLIRLSVWIWTGQDPESEPAAVTD
jgi:hypothetical protein